MNNTCSSSFGIYESARILIPGFYFASLCAFYFITILSSFALISVENGYVVILFIFVMIVSGFTMYAKETPKRRRAFSENQPSMFLQDIARRTSSIQPLNDTEARQLYFYILNHYFPLSFHDKVLFFGTVYHIMIQIRRTSFWFAILFLTSFALQTARGVSIADQRMLIFFCILICLIYLLNVKYNKADRKMQENYQDQIFWIQMNGDTVKELLHKYDTSKKAVIK